MSHLSSLPPLKHTLIPGVYQHFKGNQYRVLALARHSETLEEVVVYQALYGDRGFWVRPAAMFLASVEHEGKIIPRFRFVSP